MQFIINAINYFHARSAQDDEALALVSCQIAEAGQPFHRIVRYVDILETTYHRGAEAGIHLIVRRTMELLKAEFRPGYVFEYDMQELKKRLSDIFIELAPDFSFVNFKIMLDTTCGLTIIEKDDVISLGFATQDGILARIIYEHYL